MAHQPKQTAQPKKAPEPPKASPVTGRVFSTKDQEAFNAEADALAAQLGFSGGDELELRDITVGDARGYLRKVFHEVHQGALTPERDTPEADVVCEHLGVTDKDEMALVSAAIDAAYERELKEAPQNPTAVAAGKPANMSAALRGELDTVFHPPGSR